MGVLSKAPKSFNLDRKSHFAIQLKSLILHHLRNSSPDFADDVLSEYITVLVCNGKNQNQAKEDLEAFLGNKSEAFVSWLWEVLLKYEQSLSAKSSGRKEKTPVNSCRTCEENNSRNGMLRGLQSQGNSESDNLMDKAEETRCVTAKPCKPRDSFTYEEHISRPAKDTIPRTIQSSGLQRKSANIGSSIQVDPSVAEQQSEGVDKFEPIERSSSLSRRHPGSLSKSGPLSSTHSPRDIKLSEHPRMHAAPKKSISPPPQLASSHDNMPRRSVWDRLGKPVENVPTGDPTARFNVAKNVRFIKAWVGSNPPVLHELDKQTTRGSPLPPSRRDDQVDKGRDVHQIVGGDGANKTNGSNGAHDIAMTKSEVPSASTIRRKRHFSDLANQTNDEAAVGVRQPHKRQEVPLDTSEVVDSMHDVKLRLRHVELEMAKLRAKQIEMDNDEKARLLMNRGVVKPVEEDADSRTVLVTNLHHKATKEALSMFFGKCGAVINVVTFADTESNSFAPAQQRYAYIIFGSKESADRALGFSGTTFYSRTILVSRKADIAGATSTKLTAGISLAHASLPKHTATPDKSSFARPHLQWRRESLRSTQPETLPSNVEPSKEVAGSASHESLTPNQKPETPASNVEQVKEVARSTSLQEGSASLVLDQIEDLKQHPSASAEKSSEAEAET